MKQAVLAYASRFNALTLRERLLVAFAGAASAAFLLHFAVLAPQVKSKETLAKQIGQQRSELAALQSQLDSLAVQARDPDAVPRQRLAEARSQIVAIDTQIKTIGRNLVPAQEVPRLLQDLLGRRKGLRLVSLHTLPVADLLEQKDPAPSSGAAAPAAGAAGGVAAPGARASAEAASSAAGPSGGSGIFRHGVQFTVAGRYQELAAYLAEMERLPQQMFWSEANLRAEYPLSTLTLTVFTLSLERTWLTV